MKKLIMIFALIAFAAIQSSCEAGKTPTATAAMSAARKTAVSGSGTAATSAMGTAAKPEATAKTEDTSKPSGTVAAEGTAATQPDPTVPSAAPEPAGSAKVDVTPVPAATTGPTQTTAPAVSSRPAEATVAESILKGDLKAIFASIYEICPVQIKLGQTTLNLSNTDALRYNTGLSSPDNIEECVVSEAMIGAQAYSAVLIRVRNGADVEKVKAEILGGIDLRKWICVTASKAIVGNSGNIVFMVMSADSLVTADSVYNAFARVAGNVVGKVLERKN